MKFRILVYVCIVFALIIAESLQITLRKKKSKHQRSFTYKFSRKKLNLNSHTNVPNLGILVNRVAYGEGPAELHLQNGGQSIEFNDQNYSVTVGVLNERPEIMIAMVRGTHTLQNIFLDINAIQRDIGNGWKVHEGFLTAYRDIKKKLSTLISDMQVKHPNITDIFFMGHSLGGAVATFAAVNYINMIVNKHIFKKKSLILLSPNLKMDVSVSLITFGAPRVGNKNYASMINILPLKYNYRVIIGNDPVANVPFKNFIFGDFLHSGTEIRYLDENLKNPIMGNKNEDTCASELSTEFIKNSIPKVTDHSKYFKIDPYPLWNIITGENKVMKKSFVRRRKMKRKFRNL